MEAKSPAASFYFTFSYSLSPDIHCMSFIYMLTLIPMSMIIKEWGLKKTSEL